MSCCVSARSVVDCGSCTAKARKLRNLSACRVNLTSLLACSCTGLVLEQAGNVARQAATQEGRAGSRISAMEAVTGSYDAVEKKWQEKWQQLPTQYVPIFLGAGVFFGMLLTGLLLALWRFVLFGLH